MFFSADMPSLCSGCLHQSSHKWKIDFKEFCFQEG